MGDLTATALRYAERGVKIIATTANGKKPSTSNKALGQDYLGRDLLVGVVGLNVATMNVETIRWVFSLSGAGGNGMLCGRVNDVIVLDLDLYKEPDHDGSDG